MGPSRAYNHVTFNSGPKCQVYEISQRIGGLQLATLLRGVFNEVPLFNSINKRMRDDVRTYVILQYSGTAYAALCI